MVFDGWAGLGMCSCLDCLGCWGGGGMRRNLQQYVMSYVSPVSAKSASSNNNVHHLALFRITGSRRVQKEGRGKIPFPRKQG